MCVCVCVFSALLFVSLARLRKASFFSFFLWFVGWLLLPVVAVIVMEVFQLSFLWRWVFSHVLFGAALSAVIVVCLISTHPLQHACTRTYTRTHARTHTALK